MGDFLRHRLPGRDPTGLRVANRPFSRTVPRKGGRGARQKGKEQKQEQHPRDEAGSRHLFVIDVISNVGAPHRIRPIHAAWRPFYHEGVDAVLLEGALDVIGGKFNPPSRAARTDPAEGSRGETGIPARRNMLPAKWNPPVHLS